jgi:hypothetical protein
MVPTNVTFITDILNVLCKKPKSLKNESKMSADLNSIFYSLKDIEKKLKKDASFLQG